MRKFTTLFFLGIFIISTFCASAQIFSDIDYYGDTTNYEEANDTLWSLIDVDGDLKYGIDYPKEAGGNRTNIVKEKVLNHDFFVSADVKLFKREQYASPDQPLYEDAVLFFLYQNDTNYVKAEFFNTHGPADSRLSGFTVVINDTSYVLKKADTPADDVEEIPAETCLPFVGDTSFADWNNIKVTRKGTILSMVVNGGVYYEMDIDTLTVYQSGTSFEAIPQKVIDFLNGTGQVGIGTGNDKVYFDNVNAGYLPVEGTFSNVDYFGEAGNYSEINPWLWSVLEYDGDTRYGIDFPKEKGGNRTSIVNDKEYGHDFYISSDVKLFKRENYAPEDGAFWEDAILYCLYQNDTNYVKAEFFNTHGPADSRLSGFTVVVNDTAYVLKKADAPADDVEEIPAETCLPFVGDTSFADWNNIEVARKGTILSMVVNGEVYYEMDIDTLTVYQSGTSFEAIPQNVIDFLKGSGQVGIGTGNDKIYFDNVDAGYITVEGEFSDIPVYGDAANYTEVNPWLWDVIEEDGDTRYGIVAPKEKGGNRMSILESESLGHDFFVEADAKLFKRAAGPEDSPWWEDAILYFNYVDDKNYAFAEFFNTHGPVTGAGNDAYGLSGFNVVVDGVRYKMKKGDAPADDVEEIPAETCIPFVGDTSFADWNNIKVTRVGTILTMFVNGEEYFSMDADTLLLAQTSGATIDTVPAGAIDILKGSGNVGVGSGNDKVYFDNVNAAYITVEGIYSDVPELGDAANFTEVNPWLWDVIEEDGDTRYGIVAPKEKGGNRMTVLNDGAYDGDIFVEADAKIFKRASGPEDSPWWEDAILYFSYVDDKNYAFAEFFNTHGPVTGAGNDAYGLSGFNVVVDGVRYKMKKGDAPEDVVEEIPAETCIPFVGDTSFADWNNIKVTRAGSIITMFVNGDEYFSMNADTLSMAQTSGATIEAVPSAAIDILKGAGSIGMGSGNDKVYFDNFKVGTYTSDVTVSDIAFKASTIEGFTAGALVDEYMVTISAVDTAYIADSLEIVPNEASTVVEITSITSDIQETSGTYTVEFKLVSSDGTEETSSVVFDFTLVGIEEFSVLGYKIYPNPVQDMLRIENIEDVTSIEVYNLTGQKILSFETHGRTSIELNTSGLKTGVYLVKAYSTQNVISIARILKK